MTSDQNRHGCRLAADEARLRTDADVRADRGVTLNEKNNTIIGRRAFCPTSTSRLFDVAVGPGGAISTMGQPQR